MTKILTQFFFFHKKKSPFSRPRTLQKHTQPFKNTHNTSQPFQNTNPPTPLKQKN
eukprot:TRINITY_DN3276_c2_g1_i9.p5 TRINITY_DN3276_c2_g1~~TRINITY_DN3276_c2_g1_i9.p5  ORF type:complete len:55 (+),score=4.82 TRINITY_DN3276_c2_g1_i9:731-895(+)